MVLARNNIDVFCEFTKLRYGVDMRKHSFEQTRTMGEIARGLLNGRLLLIREFEHTSPGAEDVEVHYSDPKFLNDIEKQWDLVMFANSQVEDQNGV